MNKLVERLLTYLGLGVGSYVPVTLQVYEDRLSKVLTEEYKYRTAYVSNSAIRIKIYLNDSFVCNITLVRSESGLITDIQVEDI